MSPANVSEAPESANHFREKFYVPVPMEFCRVRPILQTVFLDALFPQAAFLLLLSHP